MVSASVRVWMTYETENCRVTVLFVLYLLTLSLFGSASLTAGIADRDVPLDDLAPQEVDFEPSP